MKTKLIIALTAIVALGILATGIVLAHNPYAPTPVYPEDRNTQDGYNYGGCYGYESYYRYQPPTPEPTQQDPTQEPAQPGYYYPPTEQDYYYPRSYGRGCWAW